MKSITFETETLRGKSGALIKVQHYFSYDRKANLWRYIIHGNIVADGLINKPCKEELVEMY